MLWGLNILKYAFTLWVPYPNAFFISPTYPQSHHYRRLTQHNIFPLHPESCSNSPRLLTCTIQITGFGCFSNMNKHLSWDFFVAFCLYFSLDWILSFSKWFPIFNIWHFSVISILYVPFKRLFTHHLCHFKIPTRKVLIKCNYLALLKYFSWCLFVCFPFVIQNLESSLENFPYLVSQAGKGAIWPHLGLQRDSLCGLKPTLLIMASIFQPRSLPFCFESHLLSLLPPKFSATFKIIHGVVSGLGRPDNVWIWRGEGRVDIIDDSEYLALMNRFSSTSPHFFHLPYFSLLCKKNMLESW